MMAHAAGGRRDGMSADHPVPERREPFVRMVKRTGLSRRKAWLIRSAAVLCALLTGALLILVFGGITRFPSTSIW